MRTKLILLLLLGMVLVSGCFNDCCEEQGFNYVFIEYDENNFTKCISSFSFDDCYVNGNDTYQVVKGCNVAYLINYETKEKICESK